VDCLELVLMVGGVDGTICYFHNLWANIS